ncbi:hypothetical protein [Saccharicrinis sp. FJH54]|uniref:hypothetical protein n=1 Tax=Saccharicrinis sp. FJH54 TaxID=3344665 RepID=UPI0035D4989E
MKFRITIILFLIFQVGKAQYLPVSLHEKDIYAFLDEMANAKLIVVNGAVKPWSRKTVAKLLLQVEAQKQNLSPRQTKELNWYLREYQNDISSNTRQKGDIDLYRPQKNTSFSLHPIGFYYGDSVSQLAVKPVWGINYFFNDNGSIYHRWGGAEAYGSRGSWGFYASLRDNHESQAISKPVYLTRRTGGNYKALDYSEMLGGITYQKDWLTIGLVKDFYTVGTNYAGSNIISDRAPSFAHIKLRLTPWDWFEFNYMHGWLISNVIDSAHSYILNDGIRRDVMHKKYIATNMFTFRPWKTLNLSLGNSVVYSDYQVNPGYLIPFLFYKSVDHSNNSTDGVGKNVGQNSSMFFDIGYRGIEHVHLYHVQFIDELKIARWTSQEEHNFYSTKTGVMVSNWPFEDLFFTVEYTKTVPVTYQHDIATTTYESNGYNFGSYMRDNADVLFLELRLHPARNLNITANYTVERKGPEYGYNRSSPDLTRHPYMEDVKYKRSLLNMGINYEPTYGLHLFINATFSNTEGEMANVYVPDFFRGSLFTLSTGFNIGF